MADYQSQYTGAQFDAAINFYLNGSFAQQSVIATPQASTTASTAFSVGNYLMLNNKMYRVTAAISSGGTITPGTNCTEITIGTEMKAFFARSWFPDGESIYSVPRGIYRTSPNNVPSEGIPINQYGALLVGGVGYPFVMYINTSGSMLVWGDTNRKWYSITTTLVN